MNLLTTQQIEQLSAILPNWALKEHPTKKNMTVIHPMAVVDVLNGVFGVGKWQTRVEKQSSEKWIQKTRNGEREVYSASAKLILDVPEYGIHLEQFGGSTNDDEGDALKGSATDALTKCASYLGIGASVYKGQGNTGDGLGTNEWAEVRDTYINEGKLNPDDYEKCSYTQKLVLDQFTKAKRKQNEEI